MGAWATRSSSIPCIIQHPFCQHCCTWHWRTRTQTLVKGRNKIRAERNHLCCKWIDPSMTINAIFDLWKHYLNPYNKSMIDHHTWPQTHYYIYSAPNYLSSINVCNSSQHCFDEKCTVGGSWEVSMKIWTSGDTAWMRLFITNGGTPLTHFSFGRFFTHRSSRPLARLWSCRGNLKNRIGPFVKGWQ